MLLYNFAPMDGKGAKEGEEEQINDEG